MSAAPLIPAWYAWKRARSFSVSQISTNAELNGGSAHAMAQMLLRLHDCEVLNELVKTPAPPCCPCCCHDGVPVDESDRGCDCASSDDAASNTTLLDLEAGAEAWCW
jgi:hypothetical protein